MDNYVGYNQILLTAKKHTNIEKQKNIFSIVEFGDKELFGHPEIVS